MPDWHSVFAPTVPPLELVLRGTITFLALMAMMRLAGQRESGGLGLTRMVEGLARVRRAYLEPNGMISIIRHPGENDMPEKKPKRL